MKMAVIVEYGSHEYFFENQIEGKVLFRGYFIGSGYVEVSRIVAVNGSGIIVEKAYIDFDNYKEYKRSSEGTWHDYLRSVRKLIEDDMARRGYISACVRAGSGVE